MDRGSVGEVSPVTPAEVVAAAGGVLVASFTLDAEGRTVGAPGGRKVNACSVCGEPGHTIRRCNGVGKAPKPTFEDRRRAELAETKRILAERAEARRAKR